MASPSQAGSSKVEAGGETLASTRENLEETRESLQETVVVTAARQNQTLGDAASFVSILDEDAIDSSPSLVLDDQLRQVPGFSLFRRSGSLVSHPTTQGVSLRGIGPSGTSRSLVLLDGIPLNDPFGGWVYWNRIPVPLLKRVEVSRGASSSLYGSSALGGTIQLLTREPSGKRLEITGSGGAFDTYDLNALAEDRLGRWGYSVSGRVLETDGFRVVPEEIEGEVDVPAFVDFQTFLGRVYFDDFYAGFNFFHEERGNGTRLQKNSSEIALFEAGLDRERWGLSFHAHSGVLESQFSRILPDRSGEFVTAQQRFESSAFGVSANLNLTDLVLVGTDWRYSKWDQQDQHLWGVFVQGLLSLNSRLDLQLGVRTDLWENQSVHSTLSPRAGILFRLSDQWTLRTSLYRGFRAPTLNELYRPFRVGNILTKENPELGAETLWGGEGGVDFHPTEKLFLRLNSFWNRLEEPVSNVTLSMDDGLILRQRQNLGSGTIRGVEIEAHARLAGGFYLQGGYLLSNSEVLETGLQFPQAPRHQLTAAAIYDGPLLVRFEGRWSDQQFEDDLNQLPLSKFAVFGLYVERELSPALGLYFAADNLFDREFVVGRTPAEKMGETRLIHGGLKLRLASE